MFLVCFVVHPSASEVCRFLSFMFWSFIGQTLIYRFCLEISLYRLIINNDLPHAEDGFGVTVNDVTKDAAFYSTTSRFVTWFGTFSQERQELWLP